MVHVEGGKRQTADVDGSKGRQCYCKVAAGSESRNEDFKFCLQTDKQHSLIWLTRIKHLDFVLFL